MANLRMWKGQVEALRDRFPAHTINLEQPDWFSQVLCTFLESVPASA